MKKVYIDISMVIVGTNFTGIPRVVMELTKQLYHDPGLELIFLEYHQKKDDFEIIDAKGFVDFCKEKKGSRKKLRTGAHIPLLGMEKDSVFFDVDAVWKTRVRRSYLYPGLKAVGVKIVPFVHDIIGVTHPQFCPGDDMLSFLDFTGAVIRYADEIVVTSRATRCAVEELCGRLDVTCPSVKIVPLGGDFKKLVEKDASGDAAWRISGKAVKGRLAGQSMVSEEILEIAKSGPYLLMVGTIDPRKNHKLLLSAYDRGLKKLGMHLVIAGHKGWDVDDFLKRMEGHEDFGKGIWHVNGASDEEIDYLYAHCYALAFPSYIEGYGLPIIESMVRGVPVIAADTPINMEVGGEYALYFSQDKPEELVEAVSGLLEKPSEYESIKDKLKSFVPPTWEETAKGISGILSGTDGPEREIST